MTRFQRQPSGLIRRLTWLGILSGLGVWTTYAISEWLFSVVLPWSITPSYAYVPLNKSFVILLFVVYPVAGSILGGLAAIVLLVASGGLTTAGNVRFDCRLRTAATFTVALAFTINLLIHGHLSRVLLPALLVSSGATVGLALSAASNVWFRRLGPLTNPWVVCLILPGATWLSRELLLGYSPFVKAVATLIYPVAVGLIAFLIHRFTGSFSSRILQRASGTPGRSLLWLVLLALSALGVSFGLEQKPYQNINPGRVLGRDPAQPSIVLITMDTVRADHLSLYGYDRDTTPNLKRLAEEATVYKRVIAPSNVTLSSHASLFTGLYATSHGAHFGLSVPFGAPLAPRFHTLAEILSEKGYVTKAVVANSALLGMAYGMAQGFQYYDDRESDSLFRQARPYDLMGSIVRLIRHHVPPVRSAQTYRNAAEINRQALTLLNQMHDGPPFLLFLNYMDAHYPYLPPPPFDALFPGKDKTFSIDSRERMERDVIQFGHKLTEQQRQHLESQYDGGIAYIDFQVGRVVAKLKELALYDNALIIITSDHGEAFGDKNYIDHASSVYQDQVSIPLLIKYPHSTRGFVIDRDVSLVDLLPTVLDVLRWKVPDKFEGCSLLRPEKEHPHCIISESFPTAKTIAFGARFRWVDRAIVSGPMKLISSPSGRRELYDLAKDPNEHENLYRSEDETSRKLEADLSGWLRTVATQPASATRLGKDTVERLRSLGYVR